MQTFPSRRPSFTVGALTAVAFGLLFASSAALAEPQSLAECVDLALRNNLAITVAEGDLVDAKAGVTGARSEFLPRVSLSGGWTHSEPEAFFDPTIGLLVQAPNESWSANANASLLLFDGFGNLARYRQATTTRSAQVELSRRTKQDVVFETERLYFDLLKKDQLRLVQDDALRLSDEQLKKTRAMKDLGASTQADVYKAEVEHSNNRLGVLRAERDLEVARAALAAYLGLDPREALEVQEEELEANEAGDPAALADRAMTGHPDLLAARSSIEASRMSVRSAKSDRFPSVSLYGNVNYSDIYSLDSPTDENTQWSYGARMSYTLFDGLLTKSNIRRAESNLVTARRGAESKERDVLFGLRQAVLDEEVTAQSIVVAEEAVKSSEEDLRLAEERYKVGEGTILEVIDAQVNLTRAKTDRVNARYDHRLALAALRNAVGDEPAPEPRE